MNWLVDSLNESLRSSANDVDTLIELGYAQEHLKHYNEAADAFRRASRLKPDSATPFYWLGWIYNDQGNTRKRKLL